MEFVDEYYDMYSILLQMTIYHKLVAFLDLLGWTNKIKLKTELRVHAARRYDIAPNEIDYLANSLEPLCMGVQRGGLEATPTTSRQSYIFGRGEESYCTARRMSTT